jgi:hypothetical protein
MNNIKLIKIYIFILVICFFYNSFLDKLNFSYSVPHFSTSFKEINGYLWESSEINILLLIKLYGIFLIAKTKDTKFYHAFLYIFMIEIALLAIFKKSSFILHSFISIIFYYLFKKN